MQKKVFMLSYLVLLLSFACTASSMMSIHVDNIVDVDTLMYMLEEGLFGLCADHMTPGGKFGGCCD